MNSEVFLKEHRADWDRLNLILDEITKRSAAALSQEDLQALGPLFRRTVAQLAYARANYPGHEMIPYLNSLVIKAHGFIYKQENLVIHRLWDFFKHEWPRLVREQWRFCVLAGLILASGMLTGFCLHHLQPSLDGFIIPDSMKGAIQARLAHGRVGSNWPIASRPAISTLIMTNNIKVGLLAFAMGFTWGLGTVLVLFYNGLMLGVLGAIVISYGYALDFWSLILPHGVLELSAIFVCGGAGLALAKALVKPGDYSRKDALIVQGKIAVKLALGTIPLFVIAALIEGFVTPTALFAQGKLAVAAFTLVLFALYIWAGSRRQPTGNRHTRR